MYPCEPNCTAGVSSGDLSHPARHHGAHQAQKQQPSANKDFLHRVSREKRSGVFIVYFLYSTALVSNNCKKAPYHVDVIDDYFKAVIKSF